MTLKLFLQRVIVVNTINITDNTSLINIIVNIEYIDARPHMINTIDSYVFEKINRKSRILSISYNCINSQYTRYKISIIDSSVNSCQ